MEIISIGLITSGLLSVFAGTFVMAGTIFRDRISWLIQYTYGRGITPWMKIFAFLLGMTMNSANWINAWKGDLTDEKEVRKYKDPNGPIRGIVWIFLGTILQVVALLLN